MAIMSDTIYLVPKLRSHICELNPSSLIQRTRRRLESRVRDIALEENRDRHNDMLRP